jgi:peptidoglycan/xylan/chitin deacetylase (PgdA/CDA1 family)
MRLDRFLTLYLFHPLTRILGRASGPRISILMYHSISDKDAEVSHPYFQTNTKPEIFTRQMQFLADNDYQVISLSEAIDLISDQSLSSASPVTGHQPPVTAVKPPVTGHRSPVTEAPRYVVLTFDDGYRDFHDVAWPILKKFGYAATMFLPTGCISSDRKQLNGRDCLTWDEVTSLAGQGAEFGAHTVSHVQLYQIDRKDIEHELRASKQTIEATLGKDVEHYSYAYAFPEQDQDFVDFYEKNLREAGYAGAVTTKIGTVKPGNNPYCLKRIPVNSQDDAELLQAKLECGYDWLNGAQVVKKRVKFAG